MSTRIWAVRMVSLLLLASPALAGEISVSGRVARDGGEPVPEARVTLLALADPATEARLAAKDATPEPAARAVTTDQGLFRLTVPTAGLWKVRVDATGFVPVETTLAPLLEDTDLPEALLDADAGLTVKVARRTGEPLEGAWVRLAREQRRFATEAPGWEPVSRIARTGPDGTARLAHAARGRSVITASAPGHVIQERRNVRGTAATFRLAPGVATVVEVHRAGGAPVAGVLVASGETLHPFGHTDSGGRLVVAVERGGELRLELFAPDGRRAEGRVRPPTDEELENKTATPARIALPERVPVEGRVIDLASRVPVGGAIVWDLREPWNGTLTDDRGGYAVAGPAGRDSEIVAGATGYLNSDPTTVQPGTRRRGPTLALRPAAAIEGTVVDGNGEPVAGADVELEVLERGNEIRIVFGRPVSTPRATTSAVGRFRLRGVSPEKDYELNVSASGYAPARQEILGLEPRTTRSGVRVELARGQRLIGSVIDERGRGIPGVELEARPAREQRGHGGALVFGGGDGDDEGFGGTSGTDGVFEIAGLPAGAFDLEARRRGYATKTVPGIDVPERPEPVDVGEIALEPGVGLQGIVLDPSGASVEGAEASVLEGGGPMMMFGGPPSGGKPAAVSGPDGWFAIEDLRAGDRVNLSFTRKSFSPARAAGIEVPRPEPLEVVMQPSSRVSGTVVDPDGKPVPGARVFLTRSRSGGIGGEMFRMMIREDAQADAEGRFLFEDVEPGEISLSAESAGWQETRIDSLEVPKGSDLQDIELPLRPGAIVEGRVLAPDGRPAIGASVAPVRGENELLSIGGDPTDGDGRYRLESLAPGRVSIEAVHPDFVRAVRDIEARPGVNALDLRFEGGQEVAGRVVDEAGAPVPGAWVRLAPVGRNWGGPDTTAGPEGSFRMEGVGDGDYGVSAGREGYASSSGDVRIQVAGNPVRDVVVRLSPGATILGSVRGLEPDEMARASVRAVRSDGEGFAEGRVGREGRYRLTDLAPGEWTVTAVHAESGRQARDRTRIEPGVLEVPLDLQFGGGYSLSGRAVHGDDPVKGASLFAHGTDVNHSGWGRTGSDGSFRLSGLEPGTYRIELRHWETGLSHDETVEVDSNREIVLRVPTAEVRGQVVDAVDRRPLSGVIVSAAPAEEEASPGFLLDRAATTDLGGRFRISDLADGTWRLSANKQGYAASAETVVVRNGRGVEDKRLALDPTEGVALDVTLPSGRFPDEVQAAVLDSLGRSLTSGNFATGENGRVRLTSVPAGTWDVILSAGGSATTSLRVVSPSEPIAVALPPACRLRVSVPELSGTTVAATATVLAADGHPFRSLSWFGDLRSEWRLGGGVLELEDLPPGEWQVTVRAADGRQWSARTTTAAAVPTEVALK